MKRFGLASTLILAAWSALATPVAAQQDVSALVDRVARLERTVTELQRTVYAGSPPPSGSLSGPVDAGAQAAIPNLLTKVQQLESQIRALTGRVEELGYQVQRVGDQVEKVQADTDLRLQALEGSGTAPAPGGRTEAAAAGALRWLRPPRRSARRRARWARSRRPMRRASAPPGPAGGQQQAALPDGSIEQQYQAAFDHLVKHDYDRAEVAFRAFVEKHPTDALAGNAQYWMGETFYVRQRYQDAAVAFLEGYQKYPKSPKAADNLLKLGMALGQVGQPAEACATYQRLQAEFPDAPSNIKRRLVQETQKLKCSG